MSGIKRPSGDQLRVPITPQPAKTAENIQRKRGPGTHRTALDVTGPNVVTPLINASAQSADSDRATFGTIPGNDEDIPTRTIDREGLTQDQDELYGTT